MKNKCKHKQWSAWNSITTNPILWKDNIRMCEKCYHWYQLKTDCTFTQEEIDKRILEYPMKNKEALAKTAEKIVIDYANLSGRETAHRAEFRELVLQHLSSLLEEKDREWKER